MSTVKLILLLTISVVFARPVQASDEPTQSTGTLRFVVDTAGFQRGGGGRSQEIYTYLDAMQLEFVSKGGRRSAEVRLTVTVVDSTLTPFREETWERKIAIREPREVYVSIPFRDLASFDFDPGSYGLLLKVEDVHGTAVGHARRIFKVPGRNEKLGASDILFASEIGLGDKGRFDKGTWRVIPNVIRHYGIGDDLKVYFEIYNLRMGDGDAGALVLGYRLIDMEGNVARRYDDVRVKKPGSKAAKVVELHTDGIKRGRYILEIEAFDKASQEYVKTRRMVSLGMEPLGVSTLSKVTGSTPG